MLDPDAPYRLLDALPRTLWLPAVINSVGHPAARLADLAVWREALQAGRLPGPGTDFSDAAALHPLREAVGALGLPALVQRAPALAEQVLRTLLWHLDRLIDRPPSQPRSEAIDAMAAAFRAEWQRQKGDWEALFALIQGLGDLSALRWDELQGLLRARERHEWREIERLQVLMQARPELAALIRRLGREQRSVEVPAHAQPRDAGTQAKGGRKAVRTLLIGAPGELRGLAHGGRLEQMLPSEAQQLRHPVLRKLWRARRAEARLLHYDSQAELIDWRPDPHATLRERDAPPAPEPLSRGPIIVALDTSMRGTPEAIAKAIVLEALRTAAREHRACKLIAFGAAGEVQERDLGLSGGGLSALLDLIGQGFDGGTDVQAPIERAIDCVRSARWASADLLIASDGEFGCAPGTLAALDEARATLGLRVQGVLIGDRETLGLMNVADHIHWVRDWRDEAPARGRGAVFSPVHSQSLTAQFFPGALDARALRHRTPTAAGR
jgi:uncharacterized protein with von Willebrand factor type A (vWA) domain